MPRRFGLPLAELAGLEVDEVSRLVVAYLRREQANGRLPHAGNTLNDVRIEAAEEGLTDDQRRDASLRIAAAWQWLEMHLMLVQHPEQSAGWSTLTSAADHLDVPGYLLDLRATDLVRGMDLDPELEQVTMREFRRGSYGLAALAALRLVEDRVRKGAGLARRDVGKDLMYKAFNSTTGVLSDPELLPAENDGRAALFAGAMGAIKNEHSHHVVHIDDVQEATELVLLASLLLRILRRAVDARDARERE